MLSFILSQLTQRLCQVIDRSEIIVALDLFFRVIYYLFNHWLFWLNLILVRRPTRIPVIRVSTLYRLILQNYLKKVYLFLKVKKDPQTIMDIINEEEEQFLKTLSRGRNLLYNTINKLGKTTVLPGKLVR